MATTGKDASTRCPAVLQFADDYGDNETTMRCQLPADHAGLHIETGLLHGQRYTVTWADRELQYETGPGRFAVKRGA